MRASVFVVAAVLALGGCAGSAQQGDGTGDGRGADPGGTAAPLTEMRVFADGTLREAFDRIETSFEQQNPSVEVVLSYGEGIDLAERIAGGEPAEVFATEDPSAMASVTAFGKAAAEAETFAGGQLRIVAVHQAGAPFVTFVREGDGSRVLIDTGVLRP